MQTTTKDKILTAAKELFVAHGFAGTSMGKVAKLAGVNQSLIFHHFQNKEKLWIAVKHDIVGATEENPKSLPDISLSFADFLRALFLRNMEIYRQQPDIVRMLNWQRLERSSCSQIGITASKEMQAWVEAFKHYQQKGDVDPQLKVEFIITMVLSIISSAALDPNIFIQQEKALNEYIDFCIEAMLKTFKSNML
jgi:AcrR family transcriptional regulator